LDKAPSNAHLHFISTEKFPLNYQEIEQSLALWPTLEPLAIQLLEAYKKQFFGTNEPHHYQFVFGQITLNLIVDDACIGLKNLLPQQHPEFNQPLWQGVDAWFLDGFSPAKNPDMWSDELFNIIVLLSKKGASLTTYTAASSVRKGLEKYGFTINKKPGFGKKRELITAILSDNSYTQAVISSKKNQTPWAYNKNFANTENTQTPQKIAVIGAGLAGCHTAYALAKQGFQVDIFEANTEIASEGSGNPQAMLYAKLSANKEPLAEFNLACLLKAQSLYSTFWPSLDDKVLGESCGLLQLAYNSNIQKKQKALADRFQYSYFLNEVSQEKASLLAGIQLDHGGIYLPDSGWINPKALCTWLVKDQKITVQTHCLVKQLITHNTGTQQQWQLHIQKEESSSYTRVFDAVVICNAHTATTFEQTAWLPTKALRGQISCIASQDPIDQLKTVVTGENYIAPASHSPDTHHRFHTIGATYDLKNTHKQLTDSEHEKNIAQLNHLITSTQEQTIEVTGGRANLRCTSPDYLPLVGCVPDKKAVVEQFDGLKNDARATIHHEGTYLSNLYINTGHGSRGLAYTPMAAQLIASQLSKTPPPLPQPLIDALNPARFIIRGIKRKSINTPNS